MKKLQLVQFASNRASITNWIAVTAMVVTLAATRPAHAGGYICAEGGGGLDKGRWADDVFAWMLGHGGERRVVVVGYHADADETVERVFLKHGATSVRHLTIPSREVADLKDTAEAILSSDIIWLRGGDQSRYVFNWRGTATERAIRTVYDRGGVIGGTSAGAAVLGEAIFDALNGSLASHEALSDPFHPLVTLTTGFLSLTPGVLFDTHFTERGRIGRLAVMLARRFEDAQQDLIGVGLDYRTAFCVYPDLTAEVLGEGAVTILHRTGESRQLILRRRPPIITDLSWSSLIHRQRYDLRTRRIIQENDTTPENPPTEQAPAARSAFSVCTLDGGTEEDAGKGKWIVQDGGNKRALFEGSVKAASGTGEIGDSVIVTRTWRGDGHIENRAGGAVWILADKKAHLALLIGDGMQVDADPTGILAFRTTRDDAPSAILHCTRDARATASTTARSRQVAAISDGRLHILGNETFYNHAKHRVVIGRRLADLNADDELDRADLELFADIVSGAPCAQWQRQSIDANGDHRVDVNDVAPFIDQLLKIFEVW
ncbi:MAG: cyanophycinase [Phycisphaerae bacterium]|nr:cyanophycinase [Phycisphaerae bacterium]